MYVQLDACDWALGEFKWQILLVEIAACCSGVLLFFLSGSYNILCGCICVPIVLLLGAHGVWLWREAGYELRTGKSSTADHDDA